MVFVRVHQKRRSRRRGFSLIEIMIATVILGIGLLGLVELHSHSIRGTVKAESIGRGTEVARQVADQLMTQTVDSLPAACGAIANPPPDKYLGGCRATAGAGTVFAADKPGACTQWLDADRIANVLDGNPVVAAADFGQGRARAYRADMVISDHPNPNFAPDGGLITIWVCWRDAKGFVQQVRTSRVIVPNLSPR